MEQLEAMDKLHTSCNTDSSKIIVGFKTGRSEHVTQYHLYKLKYINTKQLKRMMHIKVMNVAAHRERQMGDG